VPDLLNADALCYNLPGLLKILTAMLKSEETFSGQSSIEPVNLQPATVLAPPKTAGLLWVTYKKDLKWFEFSARSYAKFANGWNFAKCVVPKRDVKAFKPVCEANGIEVWGGDEWEDKPFNWHQTMKCHADDHLPGADVIFHCDADSVFAKKCSPSDWLPNRKVLMPYQNYDTFLKRSIGPDEMAGFMSGEKIDGELGPYNWKFAVEFALGRSVERECMRLLPIVHRREVYEKTRQLISERFPKKKFDGYVRSCRDKYPQSFCEFNTLGAVAHICFENGYEWWDFFGRPYEESGLWGNIIQSWSHGGLNGNCNYYGQASDQTINTPQKLFASLGILDTSKSSGLLKFWSRFKNARARRHDAK
jgi:hypothetical protein